LALTAGVDTNCPYCPPQHEHNFVPLQTCQNPLPRYELCSVLLNVVYEGQIY
jgi:hypothetical protein